MIVIADTSPINYLIRVGEIEILPKLYGKLLIPSSVCEELGRLGASESVRRWIASPPPWLEIRTPTRKADVELLRADLDEGERDAILLAQEPGADEVILDDLRGRKEAQRRHLHFIGTLGVFARRRTEWARRFQRAIGRLRRMNFYIAQEILDRLLKDADET